jgi:hypothetical protein
VLGYGYLSPQDVKVTSDGNTACIQKRGRGEERIKRKNKGKRRGL